MPGFSDILQQPYQYHEPVAPIVPKPDNTAAELISRGTQTLVQAAIARERAQLEQQQMMQNADLEAQKLQLATKAEKDNYDLHKDYYRILGDNAGGVATRRRTALETLNEEAQRRQRVSDEIASTNEKITKDPDYQFITDLSNMDKDPVGFAARYRRFSENHASDVMSIAPDVIKQLAPKIDLQKIPFREGARWVPGGEITVDGKTKMESGHFDTKDANLQQVPVWQISERYSKGDEQDRQQIMWGLMAAGQQKVATSIEKHHNEADLINPNTFNRKNVFSVSDRAQKILDAGTTTDFTHGKDVTPEVLTEKYKKGGALGVDYGGAGAGGGTGETINSEPDLPPLPEGSLPAVQPSSGFDGPPTSSNFPATKTDVTLQHAKNALAANPGARDEILRRLVAMNIDPKYLA